MMLSLFGTPQQRSISYQDVWGKGDLDWHDIAKSPVGKALAVASTVACVDIKAASIMAMPLHEYTQPDPDRPATRTRRSALLVDPSEMLSREEWVYAAISSSTLWDETIGHVVRLGSNGWPEQVEWITPDDVTQLAENGRVTYYWRGRRESEFRHGGRIVHMRRRPLPGKVHGISTAEAVEPIVTAGIEGARALYSTYLSGGIPPATLQWEGGAIDQKTADAVSARYANQRRRNMGLPFVFGRGWKFQTTDRQSVFEDLAPIRQQIATEIANAHGIPPELVGGTTGGSMTYKTLEGLTQHLEARTLLPDYTLFERTLSRLLPRPRFCRFSSDAIVRISLSDRMRAHDTAIRGGWMNRNEVRKIEDRDEIPEGDEYLWPPYRAFALPSEMETT